MCYAALDLSKSDIIAQKDSLDCYIKADGVQFTSLKIGVNFPL